ncbi:MAG TPA: hypothetical protein VHG27_06845, partial [Xanthobacteraceae bacterium]|nr:hypothetical protein [Xanthobacteraceae bacterium]
RIEAVSRRPFPPPDPRIDEIAQRASAGEQALAQIKALEARLAQAETALARAPTGGGPELAQRVAATEQSTQSLSAALADLGRRLDEAVTTAQAARETATQAAAEEVRTLSARLAALEETSRALQAAATTANRPDRDRAARLATAGLALKSAVEAGTPFAAELAAVKAAGADPAKLSPLEPFAASGLPSTQALTRELASLIASHRRQTEPAAANAGFFEWLQAGVARLVRIRPVDAPAPADSGDALAKVQASAARGAFAEAVSEAAKLPEQLRAPLDPWIQKAQGRVAALAAAHEVARDSLTALAAPDRQPIQQ